MAAGLREFVKMGDAVVGRGHRAAAPGAWNFRDVLWGSFADFLFLPRRLALRLLLDGLGPRGRLSRAD